MSAPSARAASRLDQRGTALVEFTWLAILLLLPLLYIVVCVFEVQRAAFAVTAGSRAAARAYTLAPHEGVAGERARAALEVALADHDVDDADLEVRCEPDPRNCLAPGSTVEVVVATSVRLPLVPDALGGGAPSIAVDATHRVPFGTFREDR